MAGYIGPKSTVLSTTLADVNGPADIAGELTVDGNVGIGTNTPSSLLSLSESVGVVYDSADASSELYQQHIINTNTDDGTGAFLALSSNDKGTGTAIIGSIGGSTLKDSQLVFLTRDGSATDAPIAERMRVDRSGNVIIGKTSNSFSSEGTVVSSGGVVSITNVDGRPLRLNRKTSAGSLIDFNYNDDVVGSIAIDGRIRLYSTNGSTRTGILLSGTTVLPTNHTGTLVDNQKDIGQNNYRWDDIYATNGNIQTSDANEKQAIASLTAPELEAAKAISGLFKNFKWNDSVEEKGDEARTHTGVIAQEVDQAMADVGLDAGNYAFFVSTDWVDEETGEERNRKGIRYPQLLSFVAAATEQRLASIEARLDLIEGGPS